MPQCRSSPERLFKLKSDLMEITLLRRNLRSGQRAGVTVALILSFIFSFSVNAFSDDWPQWMGPQRDNVWRETGIIEKFPDGGPKVLWRTPIAGGYAGAAVAGGKVFITDYVTADNVKDR